ncbi:unnamed protein product [Durusdinium trenchii]
MGMNVSVTYREEGKGSLLKYEGIMADRRIGGTDRESYIELKNTILIGKENEVVATEGVKRFYDAWIEDMDQAEKRLPQEITTAQAAAAARRTVGAPGNRKRLEVPVVASIWLAGGGPQKMFKQHGDSEGSDCTKRTTKKGSLHFGRLPQKSVVLRTKSLGPRQAAPPRPERSSLDLPSCVHLRPFGCGSQPCNTGFDLQPYRFNRLVSSCLALVCSSSFEGPLSGLSNHPPSRLQVAKAAVA